METNWIETIFMKTNKWVDVVFTVVGFVFTFLIMVALFPISVCFVLTLWLWEHK